MSTIYDLANIQSGDARGRQELAFDAAQTQLAQYKKEKKIIEDMNEAMKKAEEAASKNKKKWGLGGSVLGGLLGLIPGVGWAGAAALSALSAGAAEKLRQKEYDPTQALEDLKARYKGRTDVETSMDEGITNLDAALDQMVTSDAMTAGITSGLLGGMRFDKVPGVTDTAKTAAGDATTQIFDKMGTAGAQPNILDIVGGLKQGGAGTTVSQYVPLSINEGMLGAILPKQLGGLATDAAADMALGQMFQKPLGQALLGAARFGAVPFMNELQPEWEGASYHAPKFHNPYRRYS